MTETMRTGVDRCPSGGDRPVYHFGARATVQVKRMTHEHSDRGARHGNGEFDPGRMPYEDANQKN